MSSKSWPWIEEMRQILKKRSAGHSSAKRWVTWGELLGGKLTTGVWKRLGWRQTVGWGKVQVEGPGLHSTFGQRTFIRSNAKRWPKSLLKKSVTYPYIKHPTRPISFRMGDPTEAFSLPRATQIYPLKRAMGNSCGMQLSTELSPVLSSGSGSPWPIPTWGHEMLHLKTQGLTLTPASLEAFGDHKDMGRWSPHSQVSGRLAQQGNWQSQWTVSLQELCPWQPLTTLCFAVGKVWYVCMYMWYVFEKCHNS